MDWPVPPGPKESGTEYVWTEEHGQSFQMLKKRLTASPVLAFPNVELKCLLDTDSNTGVGAVLSQHQDGCERVVVYYRHTLTKAERN